MADEQSKTIYQLDPISVVQGVDYAQVVFPVQYQQGNFRITLDEILGKVDKIKIGLGNVDNTADMDKPLSNIAIQALDEKADRSHQHSVAELSDWEFYTRDFYRIGGVLDVNQIQGLTEILSGKADRFHDHALDSISGLVDILGQKAAYNHVHGLETLEGFESYRLQVVNMIAAKMSSDEANMRFGDLGARVEALETSGFVKEIPGTW